MVSDYMREPLIIVGKNEPVTKVRALLRKYGDRIAVVTGEKGKFLGFLTRRDAAVITSTKSSLRAVDLARDYPVLTPETPLEKAFKEMISQKVW
ncbi:MAG: CBS domain-containing protein, partial [Desulfurococcales archaeon]|nr:CBS domain-containing protein [Desulfurococcales archaeon]